VDNQPGPAGTESRHTRLRELLLERVHGGERGLERVEHSPLWLLAAPWFDPLPEQAVIQMPAAVVPYRGLDLLGQVGQTAEEVNHFLFLKCRVLLKRGVQVIHIRGMVLAVVDLHRLGIDVRLQGTVRISQLRQLERIWHVQPSLLKSLHPASRSPPPLPLPPPPRSYLPVSPFPPPPPPLLRLSPPPPPPLHARAPPATPPPT